MKNFVSIVILATLAIHSFGKEINIYDTSGKLKHTLSVGDFLDARIPYKSSYERFTGLNFSVLTDVRLYGEIVSIGDSQVTVRDPMFLVYNNVKSELRPTEPHHITGKLSIPISELKSLALTNNASLNSGASVGLGMMGLLASPIVSLGYGSGSFRKQRFVNWIIVNGAIILVGTIVYSLVNPGVYKFKDFNGMPNFRKYKSGILKVE